MGRFRNKPRVKLLFCKSFSFPNKWIGCGCCDYIACSMWFRRWDGYLGGLLFCFFFLWRFCFGVLFRLILFSDRYYSVIDIIQLGSLLLPGWCDITKKPQSSRTWTKMYIFCAWGLSDEGKRSNNLAETVPNKDELNKRSEYWILSKLPFLARVYGTSLRWNI